MRKEVMKHGKEGSHYKYTERHCCGNLYCKMCGLHIIEPEFDVVGVVET